MSDSGAGQRAKARAEAEREHDAEIRTEAEAKAAKEAAHERWKRACLEERLLYSFARAPKLLDDDSDASTWLGTAILMCVLCFVAFCFVTLTSHKKDPSFDRVEPIILAVLGIGAVVLITFRQTMVMFAKRAWEAEKRWMAQLPFPLENAIEVVGDFTDGGRLALEVHFVSQSVQMVEQARERMTGVDPGGWVKTQKTYLEMGAEIAERKEREKVEVVRDARLLFHDLLEVIVVPMHGAEPVARVVVRRA